MNVKKAALNIFFILLNIDEEHDRLDEWENFASIYSSLLLNIDEEYNRLDEWKKAVLNMLFIFI